MNLYQKGFVSVTLSRLHNDGSILLPQSGTVCCLNKVVPQTGNAVDGFCPRVVQVCPAAENDINTQIANATNRIITCKIKKLNLQLVVYQDIFYQNGSFSNFLTIFDRKATYRTILPLYGQYMSFSQGAEDTLPSLVSGCALLDRDSQKRFYTLFYGYAFSICHRYVPKEEETIEVVNDGFLKIFHEIKHFEPRYESFENSLKGWLRRIFINTAIDQVRKEKNRLLFMRDQIDAVEQVSVPEAGLERLSHKELLELITQLTPAYRTVFNMFVIDGYSHEEISRILNIAVGTSKSNLAKARINLQKMILHTKTQLKVHGQRAI